MTRPPTDWLPKEWVVRLAIGGSLLLAGCGDAPVAARPVALSSGGGKQVAPAAPRAFVAPRQLAPIPPAVAVAPLVVAPGPSVLAQYAPALTAPDELRSPQPPPAQQPAPAEPLPQVASLPAPQADAMRPVAEQANAMTRRALQMARKGMLFSARNELVQALQLVAQAQDVRQGGNLHVAALGAGLAALKEADDFSPQPGRAGAAIEVAQIARTHRTTILKQTGDLPAVAAQQQYYSFAQQQLAFAAAGEPAASQALAALGKIQLAVAGQGTDSQSLDGARAMAFYQAALAVDARNFLAANELGVLLARYGQLPEARRALQHSVSIQPHVEGWHNLAVVHQRLGEGELAHLAENERELLAKKQPATASAVVEQPVRWVDPRTFAASGGQPSWLQPTAARATAAKAPSTSQRR